MAADVARFQGEAVAAEAAGSRAEAEDAADAVAVEWQELDAIANAHASLAEGAVALHAELGDNLAFSAELSEVPATPPRILRALGKI